MMLTSKTLTDAASDKYPLKIIRDFYWEVTISHRVESPVDPVFVVTISPNENGIGGPASEQAHILPVLTLE